MFQKLIAALTSKNYVVAGLLVVAIAVPCYLSSDSISEFATCAVEKAKD